ncbi:MAG: carboxypeptidase-like regulatory domain-containing protein [Nitrososphaerota archaeon]
MRRWTILILLLIFMAHAQLGFGQQVSLVVRVFDPSGNPRAGVELIISNSTFRRPFETTAQGLAEFRLLSPGTYNVSATVDGVVVASATVNYPETTSLNLTLSIQNIELVVTDVDGKPVEGVSVELRSEQGPVIRRGSTDSNGRFFARDVPFSNLSQVGPYRVTGTLQRVTVLNSTINVLPESREYRLGSSVVGVLVNVLDFFGKVVNATVRFSAELLNFSTAVRTGASVKIPSSSIAGKYAVEVVKTYGQLRPEVVLLREETDLFRSLNLTYVLDVSDITIRVVDDGGDAVRGVQVLLESERLGELASGVTGARGEVTFSTVPFSEGQPGAGLYKLTAFKGSIQLSALETGVLPGETTITLKIDRIEAQFSLTRPNGAPLPNASLTMTDQVTARTYTVRSGPDGKAVLRLFPGIHNYVVSYGGVEVAQGIIDVTGPSLHIRVTQVDIELRIRVLDWFGNRVKDAEVSATWGGEALRFSRLDDDTLLTYVPVKGSVRIDVYLNGVLAERRVVWVGEPTLYEMRLRGAWVGGQLLSLETVSSIIAGAVLALLAVSIIFSWWKKPSKP